MNKKDKTEQASTELIVVTQLPVIEDQLLAVKESIQTRVDEAKSLVCTEDTYKQIKAVRADLNKEYAALEAKRKEIKKQILAPYEQFEKVYKECAGDLYASADKELAAKIAEVETGLKAEKETDLVSYFGEYRASLGLDEAITLSDAGIKVGLSDSRKSLHEKAAAFLDKIKADLTVIDTLTHGDEVLVEYKKNGFNLTGAMLIVENRHKMIEAERERKESARAAEEARKAAEQKVQEAAQETVFTAPVAAPVVTPVAEPKETEKPQILTCTFTVRATREMLVMLKNFLTEGGYDYE